MLWKVAWIDDDNWILGATIQLSQSLAQVFLARTFLINPFLAGQYGLCYLAAR